MPKAWKLLGGAGCPISLFVAAPVLLKVGVVAIFLTTGFGSAKEHPPLHACDNRSGGDLRILPAKVPGVQVSEATWKSSGHRGTFSHSGRGRVSYDFTIKYDTAVTIADVRVVVMTDKPGAGHVTIWSLEDNSYTATAANQAAQHEEDKYPVAPKAVKTAKGGIEAVEYSADDIPDIPASVMGGCPVTIQVMRVQDLRFSFGVKEAFLKDSTAIMGELRRIRGEEPLLDIEIVRPEAPTRALDKALTPRSVQYSWPYLEHILRIAINTTDTAVTQASLLVMVTSTVANPAFPVDTVVIPIGSFRPREVKEIMFDDLTRWGQNPEILGYETRDSKTLEAIGLPHRGRASAKWPKKPFVPPVSDTIYLPPAAKSWSVWPIPHASEYTGNFVSENGGCNFTVYTKEGHTLKPVQILTPDGNIVDKSPGIPKTRRIYQCPVRNEAKQKLWLTLKFNDDGVYRPGKDHGLRRAFKDLRMEAEILIQSPYGQVLWSAKDNFPAFANFMWFEGGYTVLRISPLRDQGEFGSGIPEIKTSPHLEGNPG